MIVRDLARLAAAVGRIARRDPLALLVFSRMDYWAELDAWELRLMAVSGQPRAEVRRLIAALPTDRPGMPDLRIVARAYDLCRGGVPWPELAREARGGLPASASQDG